MRSKVEKEILTKEKCKLDLLNPPQPITTWIILSILALVLVAVIVLFLINAPDPERIIVVVMLGLLLLVIVVIAPIDELLRQRKNRKIREGRFHIEQDLLVKSVQDAYHHFPTRYDNGLRNRLDFSGHGNFFLEHMEKVGRIYHRVRKYYQWSENYYMSSEGIFNTAIVGDTFYLLVYDDDPERKPIMVYNAKFFDYNKESWENA